MMGPMGAPPSPVVVIGDGVVYVAFDGKITAFEAKTLKKLAEATYWERPEPPKRPNP
jgi:outer membrane protein assembly factor BamB